MDHANQRLFERTAAAEAERGFALLRDRKALVALIERGTRGLSPELERVAIPLAEGFGDDPPRIIVTRDGHGVTCLGRGMAANVPALSWDDVQEHLRMLQDRVRAGLAAARLEEDERLGFSITHGCVHGHRMTRVEWDGLRTLGPLLLDNLDISMGSMTNTLARHRKHRRFGDGMTADLARMTWGLYVGGCHLLTALSGEAPALGHAVDAVAQGDVLLAARGFHLLVNHPERTFELARTVIKLRITDVFHLLRLCMTIIGWRFSWHREEARALDRALAKPDEDHARRAAQFMDVFVRGRAFEQELLRLIPDIFRERMPPEDAGNLDAVRTRVDATEELLRAGAPLEDAAASVGLWMRDIIEEWRPLERAFQEPRKVLLPGPPDEASARSWDMWKQAQLKSAINIGQRSIALGAAFSCAPLEALIPGDAPDPAWSAKHGARYVREVLGPVLRTGLKDGTARNEPVRNDAVVGRNEPCPCGSGKKFKKCCGA